MNCIEAPADYTTTDCAIFLAGGITDTENWQQQLIASLDEIDATLLNPRRADFPMGDFIEGRKQIEWEYRSLSRADLVAFWFPPQTVCPIALLELGVCCESGVPMVVGADLNYSRRFDLVAQLRLRRPDVNLVDSLEGLASAIQEHPVVTGRAR